MSLLSLIDSGPEDGSLSLEELTTFLCCSLDALHGKVCGVFMMIAVLHTMEITGNHMFFLILCPPPFMPFAQKYYMYKYVDTCTHAICKSVHALKYMLLDAFGAKETYFLHMFYGSCFFPHEKRELYQCNLSKA